MNDTPPETPAPAACAPAPEPSAAASLAPLREVLPKLLGVVALAWLSVLGTFALPAKLPHDGGLPTLAYWVSFTGKELLALVGLAGALFLALRAGTSARQRGREVAVSLVCVAFFVGGGALFNEYAIKRVMKVPRPSVTELHQSGVLGMTPEAFYALGDKEARRVHLRKVLAEDAPRAEAASLPQLSELLREHWIEETGYSFPSGHSFAAFCCAVFFLALGLRLPLGTLRHALLLGFAPWAAAVCYSRPFLHVHSALDVSVGSALGAACGVGAALCAARLAFPPEAGAQS